MTGIGFRGLILLTHSSPGLSPTNPWGGTGWHGAQPRVPAVQPHENEQPGSRLRVVLLARAGMVRGNANCPDPELSPNSSRRDLPSTHGTGLVRKPIVAQPGATAEVP